MKQAEQQKRKDAIDKDIADSKRDFETLYQEVANLVEQMSTLALQDCIATKQLTGALLDKLRHPRSKPIPPAPGLRRWITATHSPRFCAQAQIQTCRMKMTTPLHRAVVLGWKSCAQMLLNFGAAWQWRMRVDGARGITWRKRIQRYQVCSLTL